MMDSSCIRGLLAASGQDPALAVQLRRWLNLWTSQLIWITHTHTRIEDKIRNLILSRIYIVYKDVIKEVLSQQISLWAN